MVGSGIPISSATDNNRSNSNQGKWSYDFKVFDKLSPSCYFQFTIRSINVVLNQPLQGRTMNECSNETQEANAAGMRAAQVQHNNNSKLIIKVMKHIFVLLHTSNWKYNDFVV